MELRLYRIDSDYLKYLRKIDYRISLKNNRPYVGTITMINGIKYVIPLTSQATTKTGKKPAVIYTDIDTQYTVRSKIA